ncbi:hypothetical protein B0H10DRAFT_2033798, partial [Mycena sp. CBHHK59/15]
MDTIPRRYPQEIIDAIVDELGEDKKALIACSLAAPTFITPTRRYLFRSITLSNFGNQRVSDLLTFSPRIASFFRTLRLSFDDDTHYHDHDQQLISLIDKLEHIETLILQFYNSEPGTPLENSILRLFSNPSFSYVHLFVCDATPPSSPPRYWDASPPPPGSSPRTAALECLMLLWRGRGMSEHNFFLHPNTALHYRSLRQLHLNEERGIKFCKKLLIITSPTLEILIF